MAITASFTPAAGTLSISGDALNNAITASRNAAGNILVNNGAVPIQGGTPTVANTVLIEATGDDGNDTIALDQTNGALPAANLLGGGGDDTITGGSGNDNLRGEGGNDTLRGQGGNDFLFGGDGNDVLTGGDGDDQHFGEGGDDRFIWNPGDDTDMFEGGAGNDTAEVNGGGGAEVFTITANGTRVRFDRLDPAPFALDLGTTENLVLNAGGGDDQISATGNLAALIKITVDGGAGNDTILGSNGIDTLLGGDGNDFVDGQQGNDIAFLGAGDDVFNWDPGDGSDVVEGQAGADRLLFNGSAGAEIFAASANGGRTLFTRNLGNIVMDLDDVETIDLNALGGTDTITVNDLSGTDVTQVNIDLAGTLGGAAGDAAADVAIANGTNGNDIVDVFGAGTSVSVAGLSAAVNITNSEGANDSLVINALGGNDSITATTLPAGVVKLTIDGGAGDDALLGSQGADTFLGGDGNDFIFGDNGNDLALMGAGDDAFQWDPGDGNDIIEGQDGIDRLLFFGANVAETINILANGGRAIFFRDVANVTMDLNDVEQIDFRALGGADNIVIGDLSGTDVTEIVLDLRGPNGGGDGAADTVTVNGTNGDDVFGVASDPVGNITTFGLQASTRLFLAEAANDLLTLNGLAGDDVIDAGSLAAGRIQLAVNAGLGDDVVIGSAGGDLVNGGDGNDLALMGAGNDVFVWNPGDDNDTIEGQAGVDQLLFNGANAAENITISANGGRVIFFRNVASVTMDMNDVEEIAFNALGGADNIVVNDLSGTDVTSVALNLAATGGGGDAQPDTVFLSATNGSDAVINIASAAGAVVVSGLPHSVTITGAEGANDSLTVNGLSGNDIFDASSLNAGQIRLTIEGGVGNDVIVGSAGGDTLSGGVGFDTVSYGSSPFGVTVDLATGAASGGHATGDLLVSIENLVGSSGADTLLGSALDNVLSGASGDDLLDGRGGTNTLIGGVGNDRYFARNAGDVILEAAGQGNDTVFAAVSYALAAGAHVETLQTTGNTGTGAINLTGNAQAQTVIGNDGVNTLDSGIGAADTLVGRLGDDRYIVRNAGDTIVEGAGQGTDSAFAAVSYVLGAAAQVERLNTTGNTGTGAINLAGNAFAQTITGNDGANTLDSRAGAADTLIGRGGNDRYLVRNAGDVIVEGAGQGTDSAFAAVNYVLHSAAQVENLSTISNVGTDAINLTGNAFAQAITGNDGVNRLDSGAGAADTLIGRGGNDTYLVRNAGDTIVEGAGQGTDSAFAAVSYVLGAAAQVENLSTISNVGTGAINLAGNAFAQTITGNDGVNTLDSRAGAPDTLVGRGGNDSYLVRNAGDTVVEGAGQGIDTVFAAVSYVLGAAAQVENLLTTGNTGTGAINLTGNAFAQTIFGNDGANVLNGGAGNDTINGRGGADTFVFDTALNAATNVDTIVGYNAAQDAIRLENSVFTGLPTGILAANAFFAGPGATAAADALDRIVYNTTTGALYFDADGNGLLPAVQFAVLAGAPAITNAEFVVV